VWLHSRNADLIVNWFDPCGPASNFVSSRFYPDHMQITIYSRTIPEHFRPHHIRFVTRLCVTVACKTNTLPILMHQMRISTNQVSSVMLRSKNLEIQKMWNCERAVGWKPKTECHEID
jgi:hypothetical protein